MAWEEQQLHGKARPAVARCLEDICPWQRRIVCLHACMHPRRGETTGRPLSHYRFESPASTRDAGAKVFTPKTLVDMLCNMKVRGRTTHLCTSCELLGRLKQPAVQHLSKEFWLSVRCGAVWGRLVVVVVVVVVVVELDVVVVVVVVVEVVVVWWW